MSSESPPRPSDSAQIPSVVVQRKQGISLVWIVPILAAAIGGWLWWDALQQRGAEITIDFATADDLEAGKTKIRFKSVEVGEVESVVLKPDLSGVVVTALMGPESDALLRDSSRFWVVRPRIGLAGVSGLGTLLSGAYIEVDPGNSGKPAQAFVGLENPPQTPTDAPGLKLTLHADSLGSIAQGSPVFHNGITVGKVDAYRLALAEGADDIEIDIYIEPEYADHVRANTRFWNASGVDISFGAEGLKFTVASMVTLLSGGVEFDMPGTEARGSIAAKGTEFRLYPDRTSSREVFTDTREYVMYFTGSVRGLSTQAPVDFRGLRLGTVREYSLAYTSLEKALVRVVVDIEPQRIVGGHFDATVTPEEGLARLTKLGLRARLATGSLLTGALYVELLFDPEAADERHGKPGELEVPTVLSTSDVLAASAQDLPRIVADVRRTVSSLADVIASPDTQGAVGDLRGAATAARSALESAEQIFASVQALLAEQSGLQLRVASALEEIAGGMRSIRQLADTLERQPEALLKGKGSSVGDR